MRSVKKIIIGVRAAMAALALAAGLAAGPWACAAAPAPAGSSHAGSRRMSMNQAIRMVEAHFKARVVRADTRTENGQVVYVMRLLDSKGRVFTVRVDAASGMIL